MMLLAAWLFATRLLGAMATTQPAAGVAGLALAGAGPGAGDAGTIDIVTSQFTIHVDKRTCLATTVWANPCAGGPGAGGASPPTCGAAKTSAAVPFLSLYNKVADAHDANMEPCTTAEELGALSVPRATANHQAGATRTIRVSAAHGYGTVDILVEVSAAGHVYFKVASLAKWSADPVERHLEFGECVYLACGP